MTSGINDSLIGQMAKTVFRFCLSRTGSFHDAEDLAQEILLIACRNGNHFENERAFYAFVWKTARNVLGAWYRGRSERPAEAPDETLTDQRYEELEREAQDHEQLRLILRGLAGLSSDYRRVMVAYYIDGKHVREIARGLSLSESMVKYLLFQSRKRIREGIVMEKEPGRLSYDPVELTLFFWGGRNIYYGLFDGSRLRQNIVMACYYDKMTVEEISLQLGVPAAYLETDLKKLLEYDLLKKKGPFFQSNIVIITAKETDAVRRCGEADLKRLAGEIGDFAESNMDRVRAIGFYGCDMSANSLKWMLVSLILRKAYVELLLNEVPPDYPTDAFGNACFRFLMEKPEDDPYFMGVSSQSTEDGGIFFWDVPVNGKMIHPAVSSVRANMLMSLTETQPAGDGEKLICSELVELRLAKRNGSVILPNFPCLGKAQSDVLSGMLLPVSRLISENTKGRMGAVAGIMAEHTPEHLKDYAKKLPALFLLEEAGEIMRHLCESGRLLPMRDGMLATTVMMKNR